MIDFNKIKFFIKENKIDIFYVAAMILAIGSALVVFVWSMNIVLKAVNAAFAIIPQKMDSEIMRFDLESFEKISKKFKNDSQFFIQNSSSQNSEKPAAAAEIISASTTPSEIIIDVSNVKIEILNGTVISGLAGQWKTKFINAGFLESGVKTGNADKRDYSGISVSYNAADKILAKIAGVLQPANLPIKSLKDDKLSENSFLIIVGK